MGSDPARGALGAAGTDGLAFAAAPGFGGLPSSAVGGR
jgi:hypothetical protein